MTQLFSNTSTTVWCGLFRPNEKSRIIRVKILLKDLVQRTNGLSKFLLILPYIEICFRRDIFFRRDFKKDGTGYTFELHIYHTMIFLEMKDYGMLWPEDPRMLMFYFAYVAPKGDL